MRAAAFLRSHGDGMIRPEEVSPCRRARRVTLRANPGGWYDAEFATADVTVSGEDVAGVRLAVAKMITAAGRLIINDPAAAQTMRASTIRLMTTPTNPDDMMMMMGPNGGNAKDDFTFEIKTAPGRMNMRVAGAPSGWSLKAVRYNGVDVTDTGIDFTSGGEFDGIEVELTNRPPEVSGLVTNGGGSPVKTTR